eukprot:Awhi_evm2s14925
MSSTMESEQKCSSCGIVSNSLSVCNGCKAVKYCNKKCQRADWKAGHKVDCR